VTRNTEENQQYNANDKKVANDAGRIDSVIRFFQFLASPPAAMV
jgi:hypothetical protein